MINDVEDKIYIRNTLFSVVLWMYILSSISRGYVILLNL